VVCDDIQRNCGVALRNVDRDNIVAHFVVFFCFSLIALENCPVSLVDSGDMRDDFPLA
jgi:hypothetical protein